MTIWALDLDDSLSPDQQRTVLATLRAMMDDELGPDPTADQIDQHVAANAPYAEALLRMAAHSEGVAS